VKRPLLILASASPRRAELLKLLRVKFRIIPSDATEVAHEHLTPLEICQFNAHRKARAVAKKIPDALVLGADTLVFLDNKILGKPRNLADARRMLARLQGRTHQVVTGVSLIHLRAHRERVSARRRADPRLPVQDQSVRQGRRLCHSRIRRENHLRNLRFLQQRRRPAGGTIAGRIVRVELWIVNRLKPVCAKAFIRHTLCVSLEN
jgi:hypothetical protein